MSNNIHQPTLSYRQELVAPLFQRIRSSESCAVVGASSVGKSRLLQFILQPATKQHYLQDKADSTLLVWADCNRMTSITEWGLYELIFTAIIEACIDAKIPLSDSMKELRVETIIKESALLAQRNVELLLHELCKVQRLNLCIVFDEFDASLQYLPEQLFGNLRAMRDMNKYHLSYMLFTRDDPARLRALDECESFYELLSKSILGLRPHSREDALQVIKIQSERRHHELQTAPVGYEDELIQLSGGHPGLIVALIDALTKSQPNRQPWLEWAAEQPTTHEECRKIWEGLRGAERETLSHIANGISTGILERESLQKKGLASQQDQNVNLFSSLFKSYILKHATLTQEALHVDQKSGQVWVEGKPLEKLTAKEFDLVDYLYDHCNEIRSNEDLITHLYPGDEAYAVSENTISALVRRVRQKIEPNTKRPKYLLNIKGRGYKLVDGTEEIPN